MRTKKHNNISLVLFAILFATFGLMSKAEAITITGGPADDPACANAVPLNELRPVPIVAQGDFDGCVDKSKLLCSLERQDLDNLDNVMRYTVAKMPDGKCIRVNLVDATMFQLGVGKGTNEFRAANYLNPTKPFPLGYFIFGAMPNKRTLYVHAKVDHCKEAQGGKLSECMTERDLYLTQARKLCRGTWNDQSKAGEECSTSSTTTASIAQTPPQSRTPSNSTTTTATTATPGPSPDRATATTTAPSAPGPSPDRTTAATHAKRLMWILGPMLILAITFFILWLNKRHDCNLCHKQLEEIRDVFKLNSVTTNSGFADTIDKLLAKNRTATKSLQERLDIALASINSAKHLLGIRGRGVITDLVGGLRTRVLEICETPDEQVASAEIETEIVRRITELKQAVRQAGDHSNCVPMSAHADCMSRADHDTACATMEEQHQRALQAADQRNAELQEQLNAERAVNRTRQEETERLLPAAQAGMLYFTKHPNAKVSSKAGLEAYGAIRDIAKLMLATTQSATP